MPFTYHATATCESILMLHTKHQWIHFLLIPCFPSLWSVCCSVCSRSSGVRKEGSRSWDESRGHLHTHWQEREGWSRKIKKFLSLKRKNERKNKKRKRSGAKIFALSPPKFDVFSVRMCFFFSWGDWKGQGKNENIFVKGWLTTGRSMLPHFSLRLVCFVMCSVLS